MFFVDLCDRARTLATVLPDDVTNVFITLTARDLSESICIIARAECATTERKLLRCGATHVVMPAAIGAIRIARLVAHPDQDNEKLPAERYRMLQPKTSCCDLADYTTASDAKSIPNEVEELAQLASDLTHSIAERQVQ